MQGVALLTQSLSLTAAAVGAMTVGAGASCKCFPGDACWPSEATWTRLNVTVGGRLVATVPLGSPCHDPTYDEQACAGLRDQWLDSGIHMQSSSSVMAPFFANQSCDPFQPRDTPCTLGNYVRYAVNATGPADVQAAVKFAQDNDVRLVIRNTGHDYLGRSTGAGSLSVWTHYLKDIELIDDWQDDDGVFTTGQKAFRVGAGVQGFETSRRGRPRGPGGRDGRVPDEGARRRLPARRRPFGAEHAVRSRAGQSGCVRIRHGRWRIGDRFSFRKRRPLLGAERRGPGNYGIVTAVTVMAHPDRTVSGLSFSLSTTDSEAVYSVIDAFHEQLPDIVDAGTMVIYFFGSSFFNIPALTAYDMPQTHMEGVMAPFFAKLDSLGLAYSVGTAQYGGRLIQRSQLGNFSGAARALAEQGVTFIGVGTNVSAHSGGRPGRDNNKNAVLPAWREAIVSATLSLPWNFTAPWAEALATQREMTEVVQPIIEAATPGSGAYMNEADFRQPDFQEAFFGTVNYPKLLEIKRKWDPRGLFYATAAVGSEAYTVLDDGRLCTAAS
ncbi:hypothetical protein PG994_007816 [Apiospora phragmitis]|uniref:FAD-binding PCMH-type domain-containing protein n=1 Tax=Apiospora phragmitis TaxID=2905665 RepID=A0ABR1UR96_9PEZI